MSGLWQAPVVLLATRSLDSLLLPSCDLFFAQINKGSDGIY